ncbi:hypothetical protein L2X99_04715 [Microbacterium sp. KUDC0406]|uniref:hypothetical protein n=1 Tax=Microbacterium sp. KUDC0406 TaxID=2909588 RepID=UPI001F3FD2C4|nr:hypothetical protein [Microbacterium sp. KUDC0406]UJP10918.1 hypothetical protein L2X99_04715 [Microbacterium sp. KUDC0406]
MKKTSLVRSVPYLALVLLSLIAIGLGGWLSTRQIGAMTSALLDGTATGVEVYAGQSWVMLGAVVLGCGVIGLLLALALAAAKALLPRPQAEAGEPVDGAAQDEASSAPGADADEAAPLEDAAEAEHPAEADSPAEPVGAPGR